MTHDLDPERPQFDCKSFDLPSGNLTVCYSQRQFRNMIYLFQIRVNMPIFQSNLSNKTIEPHSTVPHSCG